MNCCCPEEDPKQSDKAYRQDEPTVVTKQPARTSSDDRIGLSNLSQHSTNNDAFSGAAVDIGPTGPERPPRSKKKKKTLIPPAESSSQTPGPTVQGRIPEGAVQDRQRWDAERQSYQTETTELNRQLGEMRTEKENLEKEKFQLQVMNATYEAELKKTKTDLERVEMEKKEIEKANIQLQSDLDGRPSKEKKQKELRKLYEDMKKSKEEVEERLQVREASFSDLKHSHLLNEHKIQAKEKQMAKLREEKKILEIEKDELLVRLSALAGRKLTDNNPNIADLSDVNRPTKLAEKFSELYDNAWTDAFSEVQDLKNFKDEEKTVTLLLKLLTLAYSMAMKAAEDQLVNLKKTLEIFSGSDDPVVNDVLKQLKDNRKKIIVPSKEVTKAYYDALGQQEPEAAKVLPDVKALKIYVDECLQLCWLMAIQDPPLYFHTDGCRKGNKFDRNAFKEYTQGGDLVDFAVWPALYLQKGGSLLAKGVVQCQKAPAKSIQEKPTPTSLESSEDVMSKPDNGDNLEATRKQFLTEKTIAKDKAEPVEKKFEPTVDNNKQRKVDIRDSPGSRANKSGFENLRDKRNMKGTVVLYKNDEAQAEKLKLAPEKIKKNSTYVPSISQNKYEMGNAENTIIMTDINQIKSETVFEVKTPSPLEAKDDYSSVPSFIAARRPEFHVTRNSKKMQSTIIEEGSVKTVERNPRNVSKEDSHAADFTKDNTSTLETQVLSTNPELPGKGIVREKLAAFQSQPSALTQCLPDISRKQGQRQNSDNLPKTVEKDTVQRNSTSEMHVEPQKVKSKQTQELKGNSPDGKNITSVASSAKKIKNLDSASHAQTNKGPHVTKLATNDSNSDQASMKQSGMIEAGLKAELSQDKLDTPGQQTVASKQQGVQKPKPSLSTKPVNKSNEPQKVAFTYKF